jgi:subtilisin family serine protease
MHKTSRTKLLVAAMAMSWLGTSPVQAADASQHVPGRILVKFKSEQDANAAHAAARDVGVNQVRKLRAGAEARTAIAKRWRVMDFAGEENLSRMMDRIARLPGVEWVEPDYIVRLSAVPNDTYFNELWGMHNTGQSGGTVDADIDAPEAWDTLTGGLVLVAVVDTGVDHNHPDLAANIWSNSGEIAGNGIDDDGNGYVDDTRGWDFVSDDNDPFDDNDHGTHVSGTIAAAGDNGLGVVGVNRHAVIMPLKFLSAAGSGSTSDAVEAIYYAIEKGARVMNHSWGGGGFSQSLSDAFTASQNAGVVMVVAAGNENRNNDSLPSYPSSLTHSNIISVAATTRTDARASFSNYGLTSVDLGAPGDAILSTVPGSGYASFSGTSMAAPHVAGAASLLIAADPSLNQAQIKDAILDSVDANAALAGKTVTGGRLNLNAALAAIQAPPPNNLPPTANAGADISLAKGATAVLNGSSSTDSDGVIVSYSWVSGRNNVVRVMSGATTAMPTIKVSPRARSGTIVTVTLTVTDDDGATASDELKVTVQ